MLYNADCISDQGIIYWFQKGSKPDGRQHFIKAAEPLVKVRALTVDYMFRRELIAVLPQALQEQESEEEE